MYFSMLAQNKNDKIPLVVSFLRKSRGLWRVAESAILVGAESELNMPVYCAAFNCNNGRTEESKRLRITFHRFPKDKSLRKQWAKAVRRSKPDGSLWEPSYLSFLCSQHFCESDIDRTGCTVRIRANAVPKLFDFSSHTRTRKTLTEITEEAVTEISSCTVPATDNRKDSSVHVSPTKESGSKLTRNSSEVAADISSCTDPATCNRKASTVHVSLDHCYQLPAARELKRRLDVAHERREVLQLEVKNARVREKRAKHSLVTMLNDLKKQRLVNEELVDKLKAYADV